jgi:transmembrane sensor
MEYQQFSTEDFIQDEFFIEWVTMPDASSDQFWKSWMAEHPEKLDEIFEAKAFIEKLRKEAQEPLLSIARTESLWSGIHQHVEEEDQPLTISPSPKKPLNRFRKLGIAASFLLIASLASLFWYQSLPSDIYYQTRYGEIKEILLPDSSRVFLNANSELVVSGDWNTLQEREVQLKGEAYFIVSTQPSPEGARKFTVHTRDFDVVVLGTRFNVINRENRKRVVLEEGKIDLQLKPDKDLPALHQDAPRQKSIAVKPGERAEIAAEAKDEPLHIEKVNTQVYSAWKTRELVFDHTPFQELISIIEDNYGYKVRVQDPELLGRKLSGTVPSDNLNTLLKSLELIFDIEISRPKEGQLVFSKAGTTP